MLGVARWQLARLLVRHAAYKIEGRAGELEIRLYGPCVQAETLVEDATWKEALAEGFRRVAAYVFGANDRRVPVAGSAPGPTAAPWRGSPRGSERIAMTAPVIASLGSEADLADRTIAFVMPSGRAMETLPRPRDPRVRLRDVPARRVAALRFRGAYGGSLPATKRAELLMRLRHAGLAPTGETTFAGYDPPSTLPWLRRNEVMVEFAPAVPGV